jgi:hypothetical protein
VGTLEPPKADASLEPFAPAEYSMVATDGALQVALGNALDAQVTAGRFGANSHVAFSIIVLAKDQSHRYAGRFDDEMHFSASLVKVAAMYAAHELLAAARRLARLKNFADPAAFYAALASTFDAQIIALTAPEIRNVGADPALMGLAPNYDQIFAATNTGLGNEPDVEFSEVFGRALISMIARGTNEGASVCIRKLSYAYINVALTKGGFFDAARARGIWLGGDYLGDKNEPKHNDARHIPYARLPSENDCITIGGVQDCDVGQISTTRLMSNLFALIELGQAPSADPKMVLETSTGQMLPDGSLKMRALLAEPKPGRADVPWVDPGPSPRRLVSAVPRFVVRRDKIGLEGLKRGPSVRSEGLIVEWKTDRRLLDELNLTGKLAISWQNLVGVPATGFDGIVNVINDTFTAYLTALR